MKLNETVLRTIIYCVICLIIISVAINRYTENEILKLKVEQQKIIQEANDILNYETKYGNFEEQMEEVEEKYQSASIPLPDQMYQGEFINQIHQKALECQIKVIKMNPNENLIDDEELPIEGLQIDISLQCSYEKLIRFLKAVEDNERFIDIKQMTIKSENASEDINCDLSLIIFRYKVSS